MIILTDGAMVDLADIRMVGSTFYLDTPGTGGVDDITDRLSQDQRNQLSRYLTDQRKMAQAAGQPSSTAGILLNQLANDPLGAPLSALNTGVRQVFASSGVQTILLVGAVALALYFVLEKEK